MTDDMRVLLERVITTQEAHGREICLVRKEVKALAEQVAQHRIGWKVFIGIGSLAAAIGIALIAYVRS